MPGLLCPCFSPCCNCFHKETIMHPSNLHFFPLALPFVLGLFLLMGLLIGLIEVGILKYAYTKIGVDRRYVFLVLLLSLVGSYVNIPVAHPFWGRFLSKRRLYNI